MSALDIASNPDLLRQEAQRLRTVADSLPDTDQAAVGLMALAGEFDRMADAIDALPPAARADFIAMLRSIRPN